MIFIFIAIVFNAYIGIIFKHFGKAEINGSVAIAVNYGVCVLTGIFMLGANPFTTEAYAASWFPWSLAIGVLLISVFNIMSLASNRVGVTLTQAANKMSLAIPVFFSIYLYQESLNGLKILGILCALVGVYFITSSHSKEKSKHKNWWLLPILFLGSGAIDTITKYVEINFIENNFSLNQYLIHSFGSAAVLGGVFLGYQISTKKIILDKKSILAGIILGIPNYFSIYFLIKALQFKGLSSSSIIPINNIGILIAVTIYGFLVFNERLSFQNKMGLGFALVSILFLLTGG